MRYSVEAKLSYRFYGPREVLLLIEAARAPSQAVLNEQLVIPGVRDLVRSDDPHSGERRAVFTAEGDVEIVYTADVEVQPQTLDFTAAEACRLHDLPPETLEYLRPSRYCPSDRFERFVQETFGDLEGGAKVAAILEWVRSNLRYEPVSDSYTTALDTFVQRAGVCRDFTHMAITLCRAADIPARAVSAYAWRLEPPDLHAVVEVYLDGGWRLADPTGKAPVEGLIRIATGRDAADIAFMSIFGEAQLLDQSFSVSLASPASAAA